MMGSAGIGWKETAEPIMPCGTAIIRAREWDEMEPYPVPSPPIPL
jgi:hypothetical protein